MNKTTLTPKLLIIISLFSPHTHAKHTNLEMVCADIKFSARELLLVFQEMKRETDLQLKQLSIKDTEDRYSLILESIKVHKILDGGLVSNCSHLFNAKGDTIEVCSNKHKGMDVCMSKASMDEDRYTLGYFAELKEKLHNIRNRKTYEH